MKTGMCLLLLLLMGCSSHTPGELAPSFPIQEDTEEEPFEHDSYQVTPLADYEIEARVMSIKKYNDKLSPLDFALGWGRMSDPVVYEPLNIKQTHRWYTYSWGSDGPPIPAKEIMQSSANTHLIPADKDILKQLKRVNEGDVVKLKGHLVMVTQKSAQGEFRWKSSLRRDDTDDGACEILYVTEVEITFED